MKDIPKRVFFDTNVYIIGVIDAMSVESEILLWAGCYSSRRCGSLFDREQGECSMFYFC